MFLIDMFLIKKMSVVDMYVCMYEFVYTCIGPFPCKMKLEVNSQISKHELKPVFIISYKSKVSENSGYYNSVLGFHFFLRHRTRDFVLEKQIVYM